MDEQTTTNEAACGRSDSTDGLERRLAMMTNKAELLAEDIDCLHMCLDDLGIKRADYRGNEYSLWGRVKRAIDAERDACANICSGITALNSDAVALLAFAAHAIRQRSNAI